ncbi:peptidase S41-like protein [Pseudoduganella lurida]|uniref:Peptidase S41-like protein n=2 Tax=Pseudoduganella lurida TaxID=1036180 RepID=A0A562R262_9BURK|nr:peptidase S41-like protein [Pseudoduganella lurida]
MALVLLAGCGGDSAAPDHPPVAVDPPALPVPVPDLPSTPAPAEPPATQPPTTQPPVAGPPIIEPPATEPPAADPIANLLHYMNRCVARPNSLPGTLRDEQTFLRLWIDETYLWYREVPSADMGAHDSATGYFDVLKTPLLTPAGQPKDRFHFSYPEARWIELSAGVERGYGIGWLRAAGVPRDWRIATVADGSSAALAGLRRGDRLVQVDGIDFASAAGADLDMVNAALSPAADGVTHRFSLQRGERMLQAALVSARVSVAPVQNTRVIATPSGPVGYLTFGSHVVPAEPQLVAAFTTLRDAGVRDLVLDLRYNGGGLLSIASEVGYMIAGARSEGRTFEHTLVNDKLTPRPPAPFATRSQQSGQPLPTLNLARVYILAGPGTCSASESIINALRGIDVDVHLVGERTCGKPYAFTPTTNCGTTYFAIQFQGVNAKGYGEYGDGFAPTCAASDDLDHALGDSAEGMLATALHHRASGACPKPAAARSAARVPALSPSLLPVRPAASEIAVHDLR